MQAQIVVYSTQKEGYEPTEWEDGAASYPVVGTRGSGLSQVRFMVADGATETYESRTWVCQLIGSFMSPDQVGDVTWPNLDRASMSRWFKSMQERWPLVAPAPRDEIEQAKYDQGTLATFVGGQLAGLDTARPVWQAVALGDAVLFHVRDGAKVEHFPPLRSADFDSAPNGIGTLPEWLGQMGSQMLMREGPLAPGDMIFVASDAFAKWMITCLEADDKTLWPMLGGLVHPSGFIQLVAAQRRAMAMKDDDVTLMRIRLLSRPPDTVVVCL
jgi:hypothetical protein